MRGGQLQANGRLFTVNSLNFVEGDHSFPDIKATLSVSAFVYRGHGIGLMPSDYCDDKMASGDLIRVLPEWSSPVIPIHVVYPTRRFLPSRLSVFLDALRKWSS